MRVRNRTLSRRPGMLIARRHGAICRATRDGAVWIGQLQPVDGAAAAASSVPRCSRSARSPSRCLAPRMIRPMGARRTAPRTPRSATRSTARSGYLHFDFYNGALSTAQCGRLRGAYAHARAAPDPGHRADGRSRFLVQRHALALHRSRREPRRRLLGQHQRHRRSRPRHPAHRHASDRSRRCRATPPPAACSWRSPPIASWRAAASC